MDAVLNDIRRDITDIKSRVDHTGETVDAMDERLTALSSSFDVFKNGSDDGDKPGIVVRVDRLERIASLLIWGGSIVGSCLLVAFVGSVLALLSLLAKKAP